MDRGGKVIHGENGEGDNQIVGVGERGAVDGGESFRGGVVERLWL